MSFDLDAVRADVPLAGKRVWVAGHRGMVGSAIVRRLASEGCEVLTVGRDRVDLRRQEAVEEWLAGARPEVVVVAAAKVGGIHANNSQPAEFLYDNLMIEANIIHGAHRLDVGKLLFLGSSCIYPKLAPQPIPESSLLTGPLEPTNEWYAIAKIAGVKLCQAYRRQYGRDFISAMPTNLYGINDNFHPAFSHVLPALMRRIHAARLEGQESVEIWGSGTPLREFLYADDLADACVFLLRRYAGYDPVNVGAGEEVSIADLARMIAGVVGYTGRFVFDASKPDGTPRKVVDASAMTALGWRPRTGLREGIEQTYRWYLEHRDAARGHAAEGNP
ncbi:MAG TPA: GDP-L-fucose synthase [Azospirillum sp.]|nr:GDP-L-fucose synthase [Azospirillum sp.]